MDEEYIDKNYQKGFNHGYWLAADDVNGKQYLNEVIKGIKNKESSYYKGLAEGKKQLEKEKYIEKISKTQEQTHNKDIQRER